MQPASPPPARRLIALLLWLRQPALPLPRSNRCITRLPACCAAYLTAASCSDLLGLRECPVRFVVCAMAGGTEAIERIEVPGASTVLRGLESPIAVPSLHLIGKSDRHSDSSRMLARLFSHAELHEAACGHEVPMGMARNASLQAQLANFTVRFERSYGQQAAGIGPAR